MGKNLTDEERHQIAFFILQNIKNGYLKHSSRSEAAARWQVSTRTISTIWAIIRGQLNAGVEVNVRLKRYGRDGGKKVIDVEALIALPLSSRRTCRSTVAGLHIGKSTVQRAIASKELRSHTNAVHPSLTSEAKEKRLEWCLTKLECNMHFKDMHNIVHIDEKWFYMTEATTRFILAPNEPEPYRVTQNKHYIPKLMFLCAVCRPIIDADGNILFDGKIGVFPYMQLKEALRDSPRRLIGTPTYRVKGTPILAPIDVIDRACIRKKLITEVIPAIKSKWPPWASKDIKIQQDNASSHILANDPEFMAVAQSDGFNITMVCQPPKSPDLNILDLGFFASIQSLQYQHPSTTFEGLLQSVRDAFEREDPKTIDKIFISLQAVMIEIMKCMGGNNFKLPHMGKDKLQRLGLLPHNLIADSEVVRGCLEHMIAIGKTEKLRDLLVSMELVQDM